jgi:formylmethanofuran dehydrogenase subunit E
MKTKKCEKCGNSSFSFHNRKDQHGDFILCMDCATPETLEAVAYAMKLERDSIN